MIKPRVYTFYQLSSHLRPILALKAGQQLSKSAETITIFAHFKIGLLLFLVPEYASSYPSSYLQAQMLSRYLDEHIMKLDGTEWDNILEEAKISAIHDMLHSFETLLQDELLRSPIYQCDEEQIGNLSIDKLLAGAHKGYPASFRKHLSPSCIQEIDEAGKCLAFERSTAAGFHVLRSVEISVKQYLAAVPGFVMPPLNRLNWGEYISLLKTNGAGRTVVDTLQAIKDNYRNPLMHPNDTLNIHDAASLMAVCQSMTEALLKDLADRALITL